MLDFDKCLFYFKWDDHGIFGIYHGICDVNVVYYVSFLLLNDPCIPGINPISSWIQCPGFFFFFEDFCIYVNKEWESHSVLSNSLWPHGLNSPWNSIGQNTGVSSLSLLHGIFPIQESHCRWILYHLSHKRSPRILEWVAYPFSRGSSQPSSQTSLLNCRWILYQLSYQGSPLFLCNFLFYVITLFDFVIKVMLS